MQKVGILATHTPQTRPFGFPHSMLCVLNGAKFHTIALWTCLDVSFNLMSDCVSWKTEPHVWKMEGVSGNETMTEHKETVETLEVVSFFFRVESFETEQGRGDRLSGWTPDRDGWVDISVPLCEHVSRLCWFGGMIVRIVCWMTLGGEHDPLTTESHSWWGTSRSLCPCGDRRSLETCSWSR